MGPYLEEAAAHAGLPLVFYMFTDVQKESTDLMYTGHEAERILRAAFGVEPQDGKAVLERVVSRKKQLIPPLIAAMQELGH